MATTPTVIYDLGDLGPFLDIVEWHTGNPSRWYFRQNVTEVGGGQTVVRCVETWFDFLIPENGDRPDDAYPEGVKSIEGKTLVGTAFANRANGTGTIIYEGKLGLGLDSEGELWTIIETGRAPDDGNGETLHWYIKYCEINFDEQSESVTINALGIGARIMMRRYTVIPVV